MYLLLLLLLLLLRLRWLLRWCCCCCWWWEGGREGRGRVGGGRRRFGIAGRSIRRRGSRDGCTVWVLLQLLLLVA